MDNLLEGEGKMNEWMKKKKRVAMHRKKVFNIINATGSMIHKQKNWTKKYHRWDDDQDECLNYFELLHKISLQSLRSILLT